MPVSFTSEFVDGRTNATLSFSGPLTEASGSLTDGNYQLTIDGGDVIDAQGAAMDVDEDGTPGGILIIGDEESDGLYRLFGDSDQNRTVNILDLLGFRQTYLLLTGDAMFDSSFDANTDGLVNITDLLRFRQNYRVTLPYEDRNSVRSKTGAVGVKVRRK